MTKRAESEEFQDWLEQQIKDAKLSPKEIAEFKKWLMSRDREPEDVEHTSSRLNVKDVAEFVAWAKDRIGDAFLNHNERRELANWLTGRLKHTSDLSDDADNIVGNLE